MNAWAIVGALVVWIATGLAGIWQGERMGADKCAAAQLKPQQAATAAMSKKADGQLKNGELALGSVTAAKTNQDQVKNDAKIITKVVKKYAKAHPDNNACTLDADGLRIWNSANAGIAPAVN